MIELSMPDFDDLEVEPLRLSKVFENKHVGGSYSEDGRIDLFLKSAVRIMCFEVRQDKFILSNIETIVANIDRITVPVGYVAWIEDPVSREIDYRITSSSLHDFEQKLIAAIDQDFEDSQNS